MNAARPVLCPGNRDRKAKLEVWRRSGERIPLTRDSSQWFLRRRFGARNANASAASKFAPPDFMEIYWIIAAPLLATLLAPALVRAAGARAAGVILALVPFFIAGWLLSQALADGPAREWSHPWLPSMGVELALRVGGFERLFLFLVSFIGGLILIYGGAYLDGDSKVGGFS
jgi:hypothetical protein